MDFFPKQNDQTLEPIRFSGEQEFFRAIVKLSQEALKGLPVTALPTLEESRMKMLSTSLLLSEKSAPGLHAAMRSALSNLGRPDTKYDLFQVMGQENALTTPYESHPLVRLEGHLLTMADNDALQFILGHELGHCFCHSDAEGKSYAATFPLILEEHPMIMRNGASSEVVAQIRHAVSAYLQSTELTADRVGLLATRDLDAALRLKMIMMTGLPSDALTWDCESFLAQAEACVEGLRESGLPLASHPDMSLRVWALAKFAQTDVYQQLSGKGPGLLSLHTLNQELMDIFSITPEVEEEDLDSERMSEEAILFSMCACVLMAWADGTLSDEEADFLEKTFGRNIPDYRRYLNLETALETLDELVPYMAASALSRKLDLFIMLFLTLQADSVVEEKELEMLLLIGGLLGCMNAWFAIFEKLCDKTTSLIIPSRERRRAIYEEVRRMGVHERLSQVFQVETLNQSQEVSEDDEESPRVCETMKIKREVRQTQSVSSEKRSREAERKQAIELYCCNLKRRSTSHTTLGRLIKLAGLKAAQREQAVTLFTEAFEAHQIAMSPSLDVNLSLEDIVELTYTGDEDVEARRTLPQDSAVAALIRAFSRLQASQVSGNGHSPSVRCREERPGRSFDLTRLNSVTQGRTERALECIEAEKDVQLLSSTEAARSRANRELSRSLELIFREMKSRAEESGASHLYLGTSFISGSVKNYEICAPLMLRGVELKRHEGGTAGWTALIPKGSTARVNHAVLRMIANKKGSVFTEDMIEKLDEAATSGDEALVACVREMGFFTGIRGGRNLDNPIVISPEELEAHAEAERQRASSNVLYPLAARTKLAEYKTDDWLCLETCAVLGFFPQSGSETIREYNDILKALQTPNVPVADILGSLENVLPPTMRGELFNKEITSKEDELVSDQAMTTQPKDGTETDADTQPKTQTGADSRHDDVILPLVSLDPSQMDALRAARTEDALVIDGPPGTGKSQVIVGIVLDALSRGLRVAVVSDKRAALDVVAQRLTANDFDDIFGLVHDVNKDRNALFNCIDARLKRSSAPANSLYNETEFNVLRQKYEAQLNAMNRHQSALSHKDEWATVSDYARCTAAHHILLQNLKDQDVSKYVVSDAHKPLFTPGYLELSPNFVDKLTQTFPQNLVGLREMLPKFLPYKSFYESNSWWGTHADVEFIRELPAFLAYMEAWAESAVQLQQNLLSWTTPAPDAPTTLDNTTRDLWLQNYRASLTSSDNSPRMTALPWHELKQRIEDFKQHWNLFAAALKSGVVTQTNDPEQILQAFFDFTNAWTSYASDILLVLSELNPTKSLPASGLLSDEQLVKLWTNNWIYFTQNADIQRDWLFLAWNDVHNIITELSTVQKSFFRFFKPSYWRLRKALTLWFERNLPYEQPDRISLETLAEKRDLAAKYLKAQKQLLPCMSAAELGLFSLSQAFTQFEQARESIHSWYETHLPAQRPDALSPNALSLLTERVALRQQAQKIFLPLAAQPALGQPAFAQELREMSNAAAELRVLFDDCTTRYEAAPIVFAAFMKQAQTDISDETMQLWQRLTTQYWCEGRLNNLCAQYPEIYALLDQNAPNGTLENVSNFKELEDELTTQARAKLRLELQTRGLLSTPKPAPHARRTPEQKTYETISAEATKKVHRTTLRTFIHNHAETGLLDILPVWLLSPETMTVLFPRKPVFDLVIFDEASQATVASSLPALLRSKRWIIAGDDKQMPPSSFFSASTQTEESSDKTKASVADVFDSESLLTLARSRTRHTRLSWHYRSQHDELIAFSNYAFYDGALKTVPERSSSEAAQKLPPDAPERCLRWVNVENAVYDKGCNPLEATRVAELIRESLQLHPNETIGVITFNIDQRNEVFDAITRLCKEDPAFAQAYETAQNLPIDRRPFVKSIENVQGDERDAILFSLGHCAVPRKNGDLRVPARFGPLGRKGGERRLNVAISRAKIRSTIVASFHPTQLSVGNVRNLGPAFFKLFVEYMWAASHDDALTRDVKLSEARRLLQSSDDAQNVERTPVQLPDDLSIAAQIAVDAENAGFDVEYDVGLGPFKIPLVLTRPDATPLAVLIDENGDGDASDLLIHRPNLLRAKGWRVLQVNAVSWLAHRPNILDAFLTAQ